jgi:hypothetical protein
MATVRACQRSCPDSQNRCASGSKTDLEFPCVSAGDNLSRNPLRIARCQRIGAMAGSALRSRARALPRKSIQPLSALASPRIRHPCNNVRQVCRNVTECQLMLQRRPPKVVGACTRAPPDGRLNKAQSLRAVWLTRCQPLGAIVPGAAEWDEAPRYRLRPAPPLVWLQTSWERQGGPRFPPGGPSSLSSASSLSELPLVAHPPKAVCPHRRA